MKPFVVEIHPIDPGTEQKLGVPIGTRTIYYAWETDKNSPSEYSTYGICGKGLNADEAIDDILTQRLEHWKKSHHPSCPRRGTCDCSTKSKNW